MRKKRKKTYFLPIIIMVLLIIIIIILLIILLRDAEASPGFVPIENTTPALEMTTGSTEIPISSNETTVINQSTSAKDENTGANGTAAEEPNRDSDFLKLVAESPSGTKVDVSGVSKEAIISCFYSEELSEAVFSRIEGKSYSKECTVSIENLHYIRVLHYGFDKSVYIGELIVNRRIAEAVMEIFLELFDAQYPIEKMLLIDEYLADDEASMSDNNTSCFNYRAVEGSTSISKHAYGMAIDLNPKYNPYVKQNENEILVMPKNGDAYADRELDCSYYIKKDDVCYNAFISRGFTWGGDWTTVKDYQHFQFWEE